MLDGPYRKTLSASTKANHMCEPDGNSPLRSLFMGLAGIVWTLILGGCSPSVVSADPALTSLVQRMGRSELSRLPEQAEILGISKEIFGRTYSSLLNDRSMAVTERAGTTRLDFLREAEGINRGQLSRDARRSYDSLLALLRDAVALEAYGYGSTGLGSASPYLITYSSGAYSDLIKFMVMNAPVHSRADAEAWLTRLETLDEAMRDERRRFEVDIRAGAIPPRAVLIRTLDRVKRMTPTGGRDHPLTAYLTEALAQTPDVSEEEISKLIARAAKQISGPMKDEYVALSKLIENTLPSAPDEPGIWRLKGGQNYYRDLVSLYSSTSITPQQLHEAGLRLVDQINAQIEPLLAELGKPDGTIGMRLRSLAIDPSYLAPDTADGLAALANRLQQRISWADAAMSRMLIVSPKAKLQIRQAPQAAQDTLLPVFYTPASLDGSRSPSLSVNPSAIRSTPEWMLPTLAFHEGVPGHHIEAGLARERPDQPVLNQIASYPAFSEGWAVYAEDLADELGAYGDNKLARIGYLQSLLLRAAGMVADTGIHAQRWSRSDAISYLETTTGLSRFDIELLVDNVSIAPGQACAYMAGRETIRRLRANARQQLGKTFDIKAFHQAVLGPGPRPLPVLEADIAEWLQSLRRPPSTSPKT